MIKIDCSCDRSSEIGIDIGGVKDIGNVDYKEYVRKELERYEEDYLSDCEHEIERSERENYLDEFVCEGVWNEEKEVVRVDVDEENWFVVMGEGCKYYEKFKVLCGKKYGEMDFNIFSDVEWKEIGTLLSC
tara:strand:+ start:13546 stop:13938 length:393 start_codon:yes stop_codon:yes gene_type:complete